MTFLGLPPDSSCSTVDYNKSIRGVKHSAGAVSSPPQAAAAGGISQGGERGVTGDPADLPAPLFFFPEVTPSLRDKSNPGIQKKKSWSALLLLFFFITSLSKSEHQEEFIRLEVSAIYNNTHTTNNCIGLTKTGPLDSKKAHLSPNGIALNLITFAQITFQPFRI